MRKGFVFVLAGFLTGAVLLACGCQNSAMAKGGTSKEWVSLYNGKNLKGWDGDPAFWSVKDGVIHGETAKENRAKNNTFLIWRGGTVKDFQLKAKFRIEGGNSGIQFRSRDMSAHKSKWSVAGYQAEVCNEQPQVGFLYDEQTGRGSLCRVGNFVVLDDQGRKLTVKKIADPQELIAAGYYKPNEWNEYLITAVGEHITMELNGYRTVELIDNDWTHRSMEGLLALQIHMGPPMVVEFKDIYLRTIECPFENAEVLFDGTNFDNWRDSSGKWKIDDEGAMVTPGGVGNIWTKKQYGDFILDLDFRTSPRGNSGIFFRTADINDEVQTGIEMQVFDNFTTADTYTVSRNSCGSVYDCVAPRRNVVNPPGEWNHVTITAVNNYIGIVMNETPLVDMNLDEWTEPHKNPDGSKNKFNNALKDFARVGYIGFQDHGDAVSYRNVRIIPLDK